MEDKPQLKDIVLGCGTRLVDVRAGDTLYLPTAHSWMGTNAWTLEVGAASAGPWIGDIQRAPCVEWFHDYTKARARYAELLRAFAAKCVKWAEEVEGELAGAAVKAGQLERTIRESRFGDKPCQHCNNTGLVPAPCPDNVPGCLVAHFTMCPVCQRSV